MFAPTLVNQASPSDAVRTVCQTMLEDIDKLAGYAETRQAMAQELYPKVGDAMN